jgi:hypothetical protein
MQLGRCALEQKSNNSVALFVVAYIAVEGMTETLFNAKAQ